MGALEGHESTGITCNWRVQGHFGLTRAGHHSAACQRLCPQQARASGDELVAAVAVSVGKGGDFKASAQIAGLVTFFYLPYHAPFAKRALSPVRATKCRGISRGLGP